MGIQTSGGIWWLVLFAGIVYVVLASNRRTRGVLGKFIPPVRMRIDLVEMAERNGWTYAPSAEIEPASLPTGQIRLSTSAAHVLSGQCFGRAFVAFQFRGWDFSRIYLRSLSTRGSMTGMVSMPLPVQVPDLAIRRRHDGNSTKVDLPGTESYQFESAEFNERYIVWSSASRKLTTDVVSPRGMEWLMWAPPDFDLMMVGRTAYTPLNGPIGGDDLEHRVKALTAFVGSIPEFVWKELAATSPLRPS